MGRSTERAAPTHAEALAVLVEAYAEDVGLAVWSEHPELTDWLRAQHEANLNRPGGF